MGEDELDRLYRTNWLAKRIIQEFPKHALSNGFSAVPASAPEQDPSPDMDSDGAPAPLNAAETPQKTDLETDPEPAGGGPGNTPSKGALESSSPPKDDLHNTSPQADDGAMAEFKRLNFSDRVPEGYLLRAQYQARVHGGAALILGLDSDPALPWSPGDEEELEPGAVVGGELLWLDVATWRQLNIEERNEDANSPEFGNPVLFKITGDHHRKDLFVHASRLIFFEGEPHLGKPTNRLQDEFWSDSVFYAVDKAIARYSLSIAGLGMAISKMDLMKVKMKGLFESMATENAEDFRARQSIFSRGISSHRVIWLDQEEDAERMPLMMQGVERGFEWILQDVCGAARTPAVKLFGRSPIGLNATGESDLEMFDQEIGVYQQLTLRPKLEKLFHAIGGQPYRIEFESPTPPPAPPPGVEPVNSENEESDD